MLSEKKVTSGEIAANNVKSVPGTKLTGTVTQNKNVFDKLVELVTGKHNDTIDELISSVSGSSGAESVGSPALKPGGSTTVGGQLAELNTGKADAVSGKVLSERDFTQAYETKLNGIAENANNYTLPTASTTVLGGVKVDGTTTVIANGVLTAQGAAAPDYVARESIAQEIIDRQNADVLESNARIAADTAINQIVNTIKSDLCAVFVFVITGFNKSGVVITATKGATVVTATTNSDGKCSIAITDLGTYTISYSKPMASGATSILADYYRQYEVAGATDDKTYLYKLGDECTSLTGGWGGTMYGDGTTVITKNANSMNVKMTTTTSPPRGNGIVNNNLIPIGGYTKLKAILTSDKASLTFKLRSTSNKADYTLGVVAETIVTSPATINTPFTIGVNISSITGNYYVGIVQMMTSEITSFNVSEVWFE